MYNLIDDILEHSIVLADALKRNWSIEVLFLKNNHPCPIQVCSSCLFGPRKKYSSITAL